MRKKAVILGLFAAVSVCTVFAAEGPVPEGIPDLDHVFVIMMENHGFSQIVGNPDAPFANQYANFANSTTNYFAVGHPSSTNYLEIVGGSNFGVRSDNAPDWHNSNCTPNLGPPPTTNTDFPASSSICPIAGIGTDAETPAVDTTNECPNPNVLDPCPPGLISIDGRSIPAAPNTVGKMIGDQLQRRGALERAIRRACQSRELTASPTATVSSPTSRPSPTTLAARTPSSNCMPQNTTRLCISRVCRTATTPTTASPMSWASKARVVFTTT